MIPIDVSYVSSYFVGSVIPIFSPIIFFFLGGGAQVCFFFVLLKYVT